MRLFRHYTELPEETRGAVLALGNFDGVHRGHQIVIETAREIAASEGRSCGVMTFEPHPRTLFSADKEPFRLTPFRIKARSIETLGADFLIAQHFDADFAGHSASEFIETVLIENLRVRHVVVGYDYVFGKKRSGDVSVLKAAQGFSTTCVDPVTAPDGDVYSSTRVRACLIEGRPRDAAGLLGRYWEVEGRVERGDQRGRLIGFPTANLHLGEYQRPATGAYAVRAGIDQGQGTIWHDGVANFGRRPSFDNREPIMEVHLFDFAGDLYQRHLRVALVDFLRPECRFDGLEALKAQIAQDATQARILLQTRHFPDQAGWVP